MSEAKMPAAEVDSVVDEQDIVSYEFAYHVLPTVADGEVADVRDRIAAHITERGGTIFAEEAAERFDLAYDISKYIEGRYRNFSSAYFGWIRFEADRAVIEEITAAIDEEKSLLRYLVIRLTKIEEEMPFYFHEALDQDKKVTDVTEEEVTDIDPNTTTETADTADVEEDAEVVSTEEAGSVDDAEPAAEETKTA